MAKKCCTCCLTEDKLEKLSKVSEHLDGSFFSKMQSKVQLIMMIQKIIFGLRYVEEQKNLFPLQFFII